MSTIHIYKSNWYLWWNFHYSCTWVFEIFYLGLNYFKQNKNTYHILHTTY